MQQPDGFDPAGRMPLDELEAACRGETGKWRRGLLNDPSYCLEIFTRALRRVGDAFADEPARNLLVTIYSEHIKANLNRSALRNAVFDDLVQQAWLRFWQAAAAGLSFASLPAALHYLSRVAVSVLMEAKRAEWRHAREVALSDLVSAEATDEGTSAHYAERALGAEDPDPSFKALQRARFRARCHELLDDPLTYKIFSMRFDLAMPPRMIALRLANSGVQLRGRTPSARAVSDLIEQCMDRLKVDQEIRDLLQSD